MDHHHHLHHHTHTQPDSSSTGCDPHLSSIVVVVDVVGAFVGIVQNFLSGGNLLLI